MSDEGRELDGKFVVASFRKEMAHETANLKRELGQSRVVVKTALDSNQLIALLSALSEEDRRKPLWSTSEGGYVHEPITGIEEVREDVVILSES